MSAIFRFVEQPSASPVTVLDLNTGGLRVKDGDFTLGVPQWTAEPDTVGGDDGYREARMTVGVDNSYTDAAASISALSRVLQQPTGWFMFQRETEHQPMFLYWYRTPPEELSWEHVYVNTFRLPVVLTCDPYLYAEPEVLSTVSVVNNPAAASGNKASYVLPAIKGDAPASLKVDIVPGQDWHGYEPFMASTSYRPEVAWGGPILWDLTAAQWTANNGTGGNTADATFVGGSYRLVSTSMDSMLTRLTGGPVTAPPIGTYKVLMRVGLTADVSIFEVRLGQQFNLTQVRWGETKTVNRFALVTQDTWATWVDMGEFTFPFGAENVDWSDVGGATIPTLEIQADRIQGTSNLRLDALLLIPISTAATIVDSRTQTSRFHGFGIEPDRSGVWDGQKERFLAYDFGTNLANIRPPELKGGWLRVVPGANNVFHLLQQSLTDTPFFLNINDSDVIANTADVTLSYMAKYLHLRPDSE